MIAALLLSCLFSCVSHAIPVPDDSLVYQKPFDRVVIWGHKLHTHTHSWIHWAFYRAFEHLGYQVLWLDSQDNTAGISFDNSLFITEGSVSRGMPIRTDCRYILHNYDYNERLRPLYENKCVVNLQVYTHVCTGRNVEQVDDFCYIEPEKVTIYMPWATDLLPHEIDAVKAQIADVAKKAVVNWIGTIGSAEPFGNSSVIDPFKRACQANGIGFAQYTHATMDENKRYIQESYIAPTLVGAWQLKEGYIPCRIFKNISYGQMGVTNSATVQELFHHKLIYNDDTHQLFYDAQEYLQEMPIQELYDLMDFVRDNHTYLNRLHHIFNFMDSIKSLN